MKEKKDSLSRIYLVYVLLCMFALAILYRIIVIQFVQGDEWRAKAEAFTTKVHEIEAVRGNIFDANGALLATSLPYYEIGIDINAPSIDDKLFREKKDSLALCLHNLFKDRSSNEYLKVLNRARKTKDRYVLLKRNVSYKDLQSLKTFPILRKGSKGGLVTLQTNKRERPFQMLAARTIGLSRPGIKPVGLEGAFDDSLKGNTGRRLMQKIAGDVWRPINDENEVEPKDGSDLYTTIDINIQDVAEHALLKALIKNKASHGCAVLMEVKTGAIKAIANLTRGKDSTSYSESLNYAIGYPTEPGSTFKLASLLAVIDDYNVSLKEKVNVGNGRCMYFNIPVTDHDAPETPDLTVQRVFEVSSNVGVTKLITKYYSKNPQQFVDKLNSFNLNRPLGLAIPGEGKPLIKQTKDKDWSGVTLPQMSYGYESLITPLQTLTLYNAVANNGKMVKPYFVKEIKRNNTVIKHFEPEVINEQIEKTGGILTPGFINTHCHLELSHLHSMIPERTGLVEFAKHIITTRNKASIEEQHDAQIKADAYMHSKGIVFIGDISNTNSSFPLKTKSKTSYHTFIELIGLDPNRKNDILHYGNLLLNEAMNLNLRASFAPHAPYSTSSELIAALSEHDHIRSMPFSIHNQESAEEDKFMRGEKSQFAELFRYLNIDISWFKPNFKSSLQSYCTLLKGQHNIFVHNTYTSEKDLALSNNKFYWCTCPRANLYIEGTLPDYATLIKHTTQICFGTDSLASNHDLDVLKDANCFFEKTNELVLTLKGLTSTAAHALNISDSFGSFINGKKTGANIVELHEKKLHLKHPLFY